MLFQKRAKYWKNESWLFSSFLEQKWLIMLMILTMNNLRLDRYASIYFNYHFIHSLMNLWWLSSLAGFAQSFDTISWIWAFYFCSDCVKPMWFCTAVYGVGRSYPVWGPTIQKSINYYSITTYGTVNHVLLTVHAIVAPLLTVHACVVSWQLVNCIQVGIPFGI